MSVGDRLSAVVRRFEAGNRFLSRLDQALEQPDRVAREGSRRGGIYTFGPWYGRSVSYTPEGVRRILASQREHARLYAAIVKPAVSLAMLDIADRYFDRRLDDKYGQRSGRDNARAFAAEAM